MTTPYSLKVVPADAGQPCDECQACCTVMGVHDEGRFEKPNYERCIHQCNTGCAIYEDRPPSCRHFYCMWKTAHHVNVYRRLRNINYRPDRCGLIFDYDPMLDVVKVWEVKPGASRWQHNKKLILKVSQDCRRPCLVIDEAWGRRATWEQVPAAQKEQMRHFAEGVSREIEREIKRRNG
jgi:hypothetical protein